MVVVLLGLGAACTDGTGPAVGSPVVDYAYPGRLPAGEVNDEVRLVGGGFDPDAVGLVNGAERQTQWYDPGLVGVILTANDLARAGTVQVAIRDPGSGRTSNAVSVEIYDQPGSIFSISPVVAIVGQGAFPDTVFGRGFGPGSVVQVNGQARPTTVVDETRLVVQISAQDAAQKGALSLVAVIGTPPVASNAVTLPVVASQRITDAFVLPIEGRTMTGDPTGARVYVADAGPAPADPGVVREIDPAGRSVLRTFPVAPSPRRLVASQDGRYLYALPESAAAIDRIDLLTGGSVRIALPDYPEGPTVALDLAVIPGRSGSFLAPLMSPFGLTLAVFDGDVPRPRTTVTGGVLVVPTELANVVYSMASQSFYRLIVQPDGVQVGATFDGLFDLSLGDIQYAGSDRIVASNGGVYDLAVGRLAGVLQLSTGAMRVDRDHERVYFLQGNELILRASSLTTFTTLGSLKVTGAVDLHGPLVRWGADGLAFFTGSNQVMLIRTTLVSQ